MAPIMFPKCGVLLTYGKAAVINMFRLWGFGVGTVLNIQPIYSLDSLKQTGIGKWVSLGLIIIMFDTKYEWICHN